MKRLIFITKFTKYWWNDCVFEFSKEYHRYSMKFTGFSIYTFRKIFFFMKRFFTMLRCVQNDRALWSGLFLSQSSLSIGEMISFLSSLRNIIDILWSTQVFLFTLLENLFLHVEILHFAALRSEWQGYVFNIRIINHRH